MAVNDIQIGGDHYKGVPVQPWDIVRMYGLNYFEGNVLKYLLRRKGDRVEDLSKAIHYLEKEIDHLTSEPTDSENTPPPAEDNPPVEAYGEMAEACDAALAGYREKAGRIILTDKAPHLFTREELERSINAHNRHHRYGDVELEGPDVT